jgi:hypothetical protein
MQPLIFLPPICLTNKVKQSNFSSSFPTHPPDGSNSQFLQLWYSLKPSLEDVCSHSFIYQVGKGFNDKIGPLEQFAREQDLSTGSMKKRVNYEEWLAHLQTLDSLAFASSSEIALLDGMLRSRSELLPQQEIVRL